MPIVPNTPRVRGSHRSVAAPNAREGSKGVTAIKTRSAPLPKGSYSQAVRVGDLLFVSGQLPLDAQGRFVGGTITDQTEQALSNIRAIVESAGGTLAHLVQCTIYISDIAYWAKVDKAYEAFLSGMPVLPARAVVPVKEMHYGADIEIQAIAFLTSK
jgi:2-iminobutanoate/2-iminopropanoate deaminase